MKRLEKLLDINLQMNISNKNKNYYLEFINTNFYTCYVKRQTIF